MDYQPTPEGKDPQLWQLAQRKVSFKSHLMLYIIVNVFFWLLWYFSGTPVQKGEGMPWPVWPALGWGIGILFHFAGAYLNTGVNPIEKEYAKLQQKKS